MVLCGIFDIGTFDNAWFDCISDKPTIIQVKDSELIKSTVASLDVQVPSVSIGQLIKPIVTTSEQKKTKSSVSKEESSVTTGE